MMERINSNDLKCLQLEIMDVIDKFCRENNIKYFMAGGTLLGAIRHQGYIPWDDDIDIVLLRKDYERLVNEFFSKKVNIEIRSGEYSPKFPYPYAKAIHNDTVMIELDKRNPIGVNIDIFPLDYAPNNKDIFNKLLKKINFYRNILTLKYLRINRKRSKCKNSIIFITKPILIMIPDKFLLHKIISLFIRKNEKTKYVASFGGAWGKKEYFPIEIFSEQIELYFEGRILYAPTGYDIYLKQLYSNYMQLPPLEERKTHHDFTAYWK